MKRADRDGELNNLALKAGFFYVLTQLIVRGITFITTPIYTRLVSTEQYGQLRVYESWLLILVPLMSLGLYRSLEKAKIDFGDKYDEYVSSVQSLSYISISVFALFFLILYKPISTFLGMNVFLFTVMFLYIFSYTSTLFYQRREKQKMQYKNVTLITTLTMLPATLLSIALLYLGNQWGYEKYLVELRVGGYYFSQILVGFFLMFLIYRQGKLLYKKIYWKYGLLYSLPLIPEQISIQIMNQSDKIMIQKMVGAESAGIFALGTTISFIMWVIEDSVWNAWQPWLYEKIARKEERDVEKPWLRIAIIFGIMTILIVIVAPEAILILGGKEYSMARYLVAPMLVGTLFRFFSYIYSAMQNYYMKTQYVAGGTIFAMILNVILNYVCIIQWGYQAAAYTTAFSYFMLMLVQGVLEKRVTGDRIIPLWKMLVISLAILVLSIGAMHMFSVNWIVRWCIACIIGVVLLLTQIPNLKKHE